LALSQILFGLPALLVLTFLTAYLGTSITFIPLLILTIFLIWGAMSAMGFFLSSHMLHMRNATQVISFVNVVLAVIPPVYYSIDRLPMALHYLLYTVPTTHSSIIIQYVMGLPTPKEWSVPLGIGVQLAYLVGLVILAKTKAL